MYTIAKKQTPRTAQADTQGRVKDTQLVDLEERFKKLKLKNKK